MFKLAFMAALGWRIGNGSADLAAKILWDLRDRLLETDEAIPGDPTPFEKKAKEFSIWILPRRDQSKRR